MNLTKEITCNRLYLKCVRKNEKAEKHRKFCRHGIEHLADTARIAYILNLERGLGIDKDIIYSAALLHDCGRWVQYKNGKPHEEASAVLAQEILGECECDEETKNLIVLAVSEHRSDSLSCNLSRIIYEADKLSRLCGFCKASDECNRAKKKRNKKINY